MSATVVLKSPSIADNEEKYEQQSWRDARRDVPISIYRHAALPSSPWAWSDFHVDVHRIHPTTQEVPDDCEWNQYSRGLVGNWTHDEREANGSQMSTHSSSDNELSTVHKVSVFDDGSFDKQADARTVRKDDDDDLQACWNYFGVSPPLNVRVQALFVEDMTLPSLQMLGTRYNIDPFFFAASAKRMSSRYQEVHNALEDRITIILPFIYTQRPITGPKPLSAPTFASAESRSWGIAESLPYAEGNKMTDAQAPLFLPGNKILFQDLLSFYMIRSTTTSTIISYHPNLQSHGSSARRLQSLMQKTGDDVYWSRIFKRSKDPTFVLLGILWYAVYAWDETLDVLFGHVNTLEHDVLESNDMTLPLAFHRLQTHILSYEQLLQDFLRSVEFIRDKPNPAMNAPSISKAEREDSAKLLFTEADSLRSEIRRLAHKRQMLSARLDNITDLTFLNMKSEYSKSRQRLAAATVKEFATLKQRVYLSMVFIPATYLANVFNMESTETRIRYIAAVVGLTLFTSWIVIAVRKESTLYPSDSVLHRILWPWFYARGAIFTKFKWTSSDESDRPDVRARYVSEGHA